MKFIDIPDSKRIEREPDDRNLIFSDGEITQDGIEIKQIELLHYRIKTDPNLGAYSIITALVDTDQGQIEILYDEGYRGDDALNDSATMLVQNLGLSGLILRSLISLKNESKDILDFLNSLDAFRRPQRLQYLIKQIVSQIS